MLSFTNDQNFSHLIKKNTCFKGKNGSIIDLILNNRKFNFKFSSTFETGLSDHHHLIYSMMKASFQKEEPKSLIYRDFDKFSMQNFKSELEPFLQSDEKSYQIFENKFTEALNKNAPKKCNHKPHVDKTLRNAIMKRSKLKNKANKSQLPIDIANFKKQRNYVSKLNKKCKVS